MNNFEKSSSESVNHLQLIGSQMNLSSRPNSESLMCRPQSAMIPYGENVEINFYDNRPRSAGCVFKKNLNSRKRSFQWTTNVNVAESDGNSFRSVLQYTNSSSKLLENLLEASNYNESKNNDISQRYYPETDSSESEENPVKQTSVPEIPFNSFSENKNGGLSDRLSYCNTNYSSVDSLNDMKRENLEGLKLQSWIPHNREEKTVRFLENFTHGDNIEQQQHHHYCHYSQNMGHHHHHHHHCGAKPSDHGCLHQKLEEEEPLYLSNATESEIRDAKIQSLSDKLSERIKCALEAFEIPDTRVEPEKDVEEGEEEVTQDQEENLKTNPEAQSCEEFTSNQSTSSSENLNIRNDNNNDLGELSPSSKSEEMKQASKMSENVNYEANLNRVINESTYEEIVRLLETLEEEDPEAMNLEENKDSEKEKCSALESNDQLNAVYSYLEEVEKDEEISGVKPDENCKSSPRNYDSPRLEELLNKSSVELAHEVLSLKIQMEDQKKGIKLLRDTLAEMKESRKSLELEHQEALHRASSEAEVMVQRHQKFIKQLLNEKKNLNETVSKLVNDLKTGEERYKKNMKAIEEKHQIEIKRAKEIQAAADKIKREKWMETKTKKIKEMTVKGLEPELSRMAARQQEEMTELRNLHRAELEAVELRAARRTSELMDDLRAELTKEKEHAIARETEAARARMEKEFEDEKNKMQKQMQILRDRIHKEEIKLTDQEMEFQQRLIDYKRDAEKEREKLAREHQEKLEEVQRRHGIELKSLRETLEAEKEIWMNNYKKQQAAKFFEREAELHQQYKRERDRDIEVIIEALEKESSQAQVELNKTNENKMKRLKEQLEGEIKELEENEANLKGKLGEAKTQLSEKEEIVLKLRTEIRQLLAEIGFLRKSCDEMSAERGNLKEIIRKEFDNKIKELIREKENVEKEMVVLKETHEKDLAKKDQLNQQAKNEMQLELTRVYSRIKTAVSKKDKVIEGLREELRGTNKKCEQLELMLDRQRRNLLLQ